MIQEYLRSFQNWKDPQGPYDFVGMVSLMGACLDNLRRNADEEELARIMDILGNHQVIFGKMIFCREKRDDVF
jgi:hypothetical protein